MSLVAGGKFKGRLHNHVYQRITPARGAAYKSKKAPRGKKSVKQSVKEEVIRQLSGSGFIGGKGVPLRQQMTRVTRAKRGPVHRSARQTAYTEFVQEYFARNPLPRGSEQKAYQDRMKDAARAWRAQ